MMTRALSTFLGAFKYEFLMQVRRWMLWLTLIIITLLVLIIFSHSSYVTTSYIPMLAKLPIQNVVGRLAATLNFLVPIGVGCVLADRLVRDRRFKTEELFNTTSASLFARLWGKYLGCVLATALPTFIIYTLGLGFVLWQTHNPLTLPLGFLAFLTIILPGYLFIGAFSLACPRYMWVPLYQFLFTCYWFWGNQLSPTTGIPTISETILTPAGKYAAEGFFQADMSSVSHDPLLALASVGTLLSAALITIFALWRLMLLERNQ